MRGIFSYDFHFLERARLGPLFGRVQLSRGEAPESVNQVGVALMMKVFLVAIFFTPGK